MDYQTFEQRPDLENLVKCYWTLHVPKEVAKGKQQVLSDGCMEMIFNALKMSDAC